MDLALEILEEFGYTTQFRRFGTGSYVNGRWTGPAPVVTDFFASIQPLTDAEMLSLPEGRRTRRYVKCYTNTLLRIASQNPPIVADQVFFDGNWFEVEVVETWIWQPPQINFWKARLALVNPS